MGLADLLSYRVDRLRFKATNLDLALAAVAVFALPFACNALLSVTGALLPLALYYGVFCFGLVLWRKGSLDYVRPVAWALPLFLTLLIVQLVAQLSGWLTIIPTNDPATGVAVTLAVWVPLNALSEQLLWVYIFDAFETRWTARRKRLLGGIVGVLMVLAFVGFIHAVFWGQFLPSFETEAPWSVVFFAAQFVMTIGYLLLYRRTGSMLPVFLLHIIADVALVLGAGYSILPDLWTL